MTTIERKRRLKNKIDISDEETLERIEKLLLEEEVYKLSEKQILKVNEATLEYENGNSTLNEDEQKEIKRWFLEQEK